MRFSNARIDAFIEEDVPYIDLTCEVLGVHNQPGEMEYFTRESCVLAGTEIARRIMRNLDCEVLTSSKDGQLVSAGQTFFTVRGAAADLHAAWKVCLNVFDHLSAVATETRSMVDAVHAVNPECEVLTTRKSMPGAKDLLTCAVMAGVRFLTALGCRKPCWYSSSTLRFLVGSTVLSKKCLALRHGVWKRSCL